jgi:hypothetical protein
MINTRDNILPTALDDATKKGLSVAQLDSIVGLLEENETMIQALIDEGNYKHNVSSIARVVNIIASQMTSTLSLGATTKIEVLVSDTVTIASSAVDCFMKNEPISEECVNEALISFSFEKTVGKLGTLLRNVFTLVEKTKELQATDSGYRGILMDLKRTNNQVKQDLETANIRRDNRLEDKAIQAWVNSFKERIDAVCG